MSEGRAHGGYARAVEWGLLCKGQEGQGRKRGEKGGRGSLYLLMESSSSPPPPPSSPSSSTRNWVLPFRIPSLPWRSVLRPPTHRSTSRQLAQIRHQLVVEDQSTGRFSRFGNGSWKKLGQSEGHSAGMRRCRSRKKAHIRQVDTELFEVVWSQVELR